MLMGDVPRYLKESDVRDIRANVTILWEKCEEQRRKQEKMELKYDSMNELNTAINVMSVTLEHIVEHNTRQDERQDKQDNLMTAQNKTLEHINQNLNELNLGQKSLSRKVDSLEDRVDTNEKKHSVDLRDIDYESKKNLLQQYGAPAGIGAALMLIILEIIKQLM